MPLCARIIRDSEPLSMKWNFYHVISMSIASAMDSAESVAGQILPGWKYGEIILVTEELVRRMNDLGYSTLSGTPLAKKGTYTLDNSYTFLDDTDGEVLELKRGDELMLYRS